MSVTFLLILIGWIRLGQTTYMYMYIYIYIYIIMQVKVRYIKRGINNSLAQKLCARVFFFGAYFTTLSVSL
jgi:hypothetical protein